MMRWRSLDNEPRKNDETYDRMGTFAKLLL